MKIGLLINGATGFELFWASLPLVDDEVGLEPMTQELPAPLEEEAAADEVAAAETPVDETPETEAPEIEAPLVAAPPAETPASSESEELEQLLKQTHETAQGVQAANLNAELELGSQMVETTSALDDVLSDVPGPGLKSEMPATHAAALTSSPPLVKPTPVTESVPSVAAQALKAEVQKLQAEEAQVEKAEVEQGKPQKAQAEEAQAAAGVAQAEEITAETKPPKAVVQNVEKELQHAEAELVEIEPHKAPDNQAQAEVVKAAEALKLDVPAENQENHNLETKIQEAQNPKDLLVQVTKEGEPPAQVQAAEQELVRAEEALGKEAHVEEAQVDKVKEDLKHAEEAEAHLKIDKTEHLEGEGQLPAPVQAAEEEVLLAEEALGKEAELEGAQVEKHAEAELVEAKPLVEKIEKLKEAKPVEAQAEHPEVEEAQEAQKLEAHAENLEEAQVQAAQNMEVKAEQAATKKAHHQKAENQQAEAEVVQAVQEATAHSEENPEAQSSPTPPETPFDATLHELSKPLEEAEVAAEETLKESPTTMSPSGNTPREASKISEPIVI